MSSNYDVFDLHNALFVLSLTAALGYGINTRSPPSLLRMVTKTAAIGVLAFLSTVLSAPPFLIAAQSFGALGDAFLSWDGDKAFLSGLASFLTAHLFYIGLFIENGFGSETLLSQTWRIATAAVMVLLASGMVVALLPRVAGHLRVPILVYSVVICTMNLTALTVENDRLIIGAVMFTTSDSLLATEKFLLATTSSHRAWMEYAVWGLYYFGQVLIMLGLIDFL
ncbi:hypothetical protein ACJ41O_013009 [Fusarium nematophilum]